MTALNMKFFGFTYCVGARSPWEILALDRLNDGINTVTCLYKPTDPIVTRLTIIQELGNYVCDLNSGKVRSRSPWPINILIPMEGKK